MDVDAEASLLELSWPPDATRALVLSGAALARVRKELASADELRRLQRNRLKNVFEIAIGHKVRMLLARSLSLR